MTTQTDIRNALTSAINGASFGVPIMFPNQKNWTTPSNAQWLRVTYLFGNKDPLSLNDTDQQTIICYVDCFTPKGSGNISAYSIADKLDALFSKKNPLLTSDGTKLNVLNSSINSGVDGTTSDSDSFYITQFSATIRVYLPKL